MLSEWVAERSCHVASSIGVGGEIGYSSITFDISTEIRTACIDEGCIRTIVDDATFLELNL